MAKVKPKKAKKAAFAKKASASRRKPFTKKKAKKVQAVKGKLIGRVTHYFDHIKVAVVKLSAPLKVGSLIRIEGGKSTDFKQEVLSMQVDHESVKLAKKGKSIGLKVKEKAREGYKVYKV